MPGDRKGRRIGASGEQIGRGEVDGGQNPSRFGVNIGDGSKEVDYCQGTVPQFYHSNVRPGSGVDGKGWREFCSLVRR